ncbi:RNA polymerase sigma-70 factor [Paenibacillus sp. J2TS4]|uniref:RNA polymerase sigma-70 factor n=1 Tax=Paenibacillus sp. J2TS4 TaxID=2807194 RepID=UPI001B27564A|nr:RNA polymerase sigma-70 factor [Paenibacillus sp. J2TS4]GIP33603.1 RNA polymerase sigma factor SigJ [Paenibacillus sp. J2TS4]
METEQLYNDLKPLLFSLAYRMMGSVMDAEDIVQEAFITLQNAQSDEVLNIKAYMCKIVTNSCINRLKSASRQRETYLGPWLPEPYATNGDSKDPLNNYISKETLSTAYLLLLQQLSTMERVVFLLREVFQYPFNEIAEMVDKSSGNCRQIFYRAKRSIGDISDKNIPSKTNTGPMVEQFVQALVTGNMDRLLNILTSETVLFTDGGGKAKAAIRPIVGQDLITRYFTAIRPEVPQNFTCDILEINGYPGIVLKVMDYIFAVITFQIMDDRISNIYILMNPDKLLHFNRI